MIDLNRHYRMIIYMVCYGSYQDIYDIFLKQFKKNWPDCPYPLIIGNQYYPINDDHILTIDFDDKFSENERIRYICNMIDADYYLCFEVDRIIMNRVDNKEVKKILDFMDKQNVPYFRCNASTCKKKKEDAYPGYNHYYHIPGNEPYGVPGSTVIWRKDLKISIFGTDIEDGYKWEAYQNKRAALSSEKWMENYATADSNVFHIMHCIEKQKWIRKSKKKLKLEGYDLSENTRECQTISEGMVSYIKGVFIHIPGTTRYRIKRICKKLGLKYTTDY